MCLYSISLAYTACFITILYKCGMFLSEPPSGNTSPIGHLLQIMNFLYNTPSENRTEFTKLKVACKYASIERGCASYWLSDGCNF